ncbi:hypothetical protein [Motiliproteus sp. SC1-56]|uniref:hypothetical protein n=1 Tax=Motiliproteus sp. SC1-56 TaxID=2799565 RepID=UPI001A8FF322|nr:hypothetical protein [Motiliproteus sp. SC1-56]
MKKRVTFSLCLLGTLPLAAGAQQLTAYGPVKGDRELSISGTGSSERNLDATSFGFTADLGWYVKDNVVIGARQSLNYADVEGESLDEDFWNGATRGYYNHQFEFGSAKPFLGASLGYIYGDGVDESAFAGLEAGAKYYVLPKTYIIGRMEYQWFFERDSSADDAFKEGAWAYTLGLGYNF